MVDGKEADASKAADTEGEGSPTFSAVEAKLAEIQAKNSGVTETETETEVEAETETEVEAKTETKPESEKDDEPLLPSGHRRAALARGYTSEEIDHYLKTKPDEATERFEQLFNEWQEENSRWSQRGRQLRAAAPESKGETKETPGALPHYDAEALVAEHGNEDLINALVSPLNAVIDRVNAAAEKLSHSEDFLRNTEQNALATVTQDFLTSKEMKPFSKTYGGEIKDLTEEQVKSRMELFGQADILVAGAKDHGVDMSVLNALERAHILLSQGSRDEAIRENIRTSMTKRTKTIRSSHKQTTSSDANQPVSDEELEKRTESRLRALRNKK